MSCPDCFRGAQHNHTEPKGTIETIHGIKTYVAGGSDPSRSKSTIIYLPDAFSLKLVNNKVLADEYATQTGCKVYIPDVIRNGGGVLTKIYTIFLILPEAVPFMLFGKPENVYPQILDYARAVKKDLPAGGKLGVAGFCWGAWPSTKLCAETATPGGSERLIDAQFNGHPSYIVNTPDMVVDAIKKFKVPYSVAVAEEDMQFNKAEAEKMEARLRDDIGVSGGEQGYIYEFRIYKGCKHGFCVRAPLGKTKKEHDSENEDGYHGSLKQAVEWWNKYLN
ncbi:hypothetical protein LTR10_022257 [Elasticomyces elasticus]|uniref:Dienelactone hydrolase domain-containing protein n=1 Tax=Exophiala sideris TaxID=1016849 RepID=A0ABR0JSG1_9EURO|nr:hypothetical protein LTR10_022257 [Elasticomyces elasticus]KAK5040469.1 hypothetical protein LTS07_000967 [Exophiala sideris]KAK5068847.1 hypothetical protein LTR69_000968 [Exophiala sideris]KAK5186443.1 hypothetical protein LTR44_001499 [Eurotiomycetes sp. CCFEE 6388]